MITDISISNKPINYCNVKCSENTNTPTTTATKGSIEPRMAVVVEPAYFTAKINVRSEMTVDRNANAKI